MILDRKTAKIVFIFSIILSAVLTILMLAGIIDEQLQFGIQICSYVVLLILNWLSLGNQYSMSDKLQETCFIMIALGILFFVGPHHWLSEGVQLTILIGTMLVMLFLNRKELRSLKNDIGDKKGKKRSSIMIILYIASFLLFYFIQEVTTLSSFLATVILLCAVIAMTYELYEIAMQEQEMEEQVIV